MDWRDASIDGRNMRAYGAVAGLKMTLINVVRGEFQ